jgi:hypothetical protein
MAQHDYNIANQGFPAFRTDLNNALSAIQTTNSGTSRPTGAVAGQLWLDTTSATTPTLKYYDGADDISLATIDHSANTVNWLDSTVSITGLTTTATGTVLTLSDSATTSTVNLIIDNQKEIRFRETTANGTNYIGLKAPASVSADLTFTLPATDGTSGQVLQTNGSGVLSFATVGGLAWQTIVTGSTLSAVASRGYWIDTTSNACTVTLPASATNGDTIILADYARNWQTNAVTINTNSLNFQGATTPNPIYNTKGQSVTLVYSGATKGWIPTVDDDVTLETPVPYSVDFLVVAGGGGGGSAGGGAGGFRTSTQSVSSGTVITVTVGAFGAGGSTTTNGSSGSNSSISGSGLTTITSAGGGGGGKDNTNGISGGSGGGGGRDSATTGGSGNTPSTSPSQGNNGGNGSVGPYGGAAGGGGAGAVGSNAPAATPPSTAGGNGGNGTASSITGSSVTYAGGGGGCSNNDSTGTGGTGGTGGGGAGSNNQAGSGTAGTANTGGGGGGADEGGSGGSGGTGVVILSMATANYSTITTGSPTVTTKNAGADTVLTFTGSGSYTA